MLFHPYLLFFGLSSLQQSSLSFPNSSWLDLAKVSKNLVIAFFIFLNIISPQIYHKYLLNACITLNSVYFMLHNHFCIILNDYGDIMKKNKAVES